MKSHIFFKALCVTTLLSIGSAHSMQQPISNAKIELGALDNKTSSLIRLEQIPMSAHSLFVQPSNNLLIKEILPKTMADLATPISFEEQNNPNLLSAKYKIINDSNNELFAHLILDKQEGILKGSLLKNESPKPVHESLLKLSRPQQSKIYVVFRIIGDNYEKSKIELSTDRPKLEIEKKSRTTSKPNFHFYIPGLFRW